MEGFSFLIAIVSIVWGVLSIILFFKVWGMTNDIRDIKNVYLGLNQQEIEKNNEAYKVTDNKYHYTDSKFQINDIVISPNYDGELKVFDIMGNGEYNCRDAKTGEKAGFFKESELVLNNKNS